MNKFKKSQALVFFVLILLLAITPYLPSSLRTTYFYFISINFIIIALGAEAGLFSPFVKPLEDTKQFASVIIPQEASSEKREASTTADLSAVSENVEIKKVKAVEKSAFEKVVSVIKVDKVQKGPSSRASLFFIGNGEDDAEVMDEETEEEVEIEGVNRQELFAKAEVFIGNFYKQLKMQRVLDLSESLLIKRTALASAVE